MQLRSISNDIATLEIARTLLIARPKLGKVFFTICRSCDVFIVVQQREIGLNSLGECIDKPCDPMLTFPPSYLYYNLLRSR